MASKVAGSLISSSGCANKSSSVKQAQPRAANNSNTAGLLTCNGSDLVRRLPEIVQNIM